MCPVYQWRGADGATVEVLRKFDEYLEPPTREELEEAGLNPDQQYEKLISQGIRTVWAPGWGSGPMNSGKGNWGK